jgi:hypothetical protein
MSLTPLENLLLVHQLAADPVIPQNAQKNRYALHLLLTSLITDEVVRHRRASSIPIGNEQTLTEARNAIGQDTRTSKQELISWSWLYYHYVRVEFNISAKEYSQIAFITDRTLRRYHGHGVRRLTQYLIAREHIVRENLSNTFLLTAFYPTPV